jgi:hypothetical protein
VARRVCAYYERNRMTNLPSWCVGLLLRPLGRKFSPFRRFSFKVTIVRSVASIVQVHQRRAGFHFAGEWEKMLLDNGRRCASYRSRAMTNWICNPGIGYGSAG